MIHDSHRMRLKVHFIKRYDIITLQVTFPMSIKSYLMQLKGTIIRDDNDNNQIT